MSDPGIDPYALNVEQIEVFIRVLDKNGDGVLQPHELHIEDQELFRSLDSNGNGRLEVDEINTAILEDRFILSLSGDDAVAALIRFDTDGDGYLSRDELNRSYGVYMTVDGHGADSPHGDQEMSFPDGRGGEVPIGALRMDGRLSIAEVALAMDDGVVFVGRSLLVRTEEPAP